MAGYKCPWVAYSDNSIPTAGFVRTHGVWTHTGRSEGYILANRPVKLYWNTHGYNMTLCPVTPYDNVKVWICGAGTTSDTASAQLVACTEAKGSSEQLWYYGGLDGYYVTYTFRFNWFRCYNSIAQQGGEHTRNPDIALNTREDARSFSQIEDAVNDNDWVWASVDGYEGEIPAGDLVITEPIPAPDPIVVRITAQRIPAPGDDPNAQGGYSGVGGGTGDFDETSDPVLLPTLPSELFSAANAGLVTILAPTITELRSLSDYLWTSWMDVPENLKRIFNNPMDYFISLHLVPLQVPTSTRVNVKLGLSTTSVSMAKAANQFVSFDCGNVELSEYWGSALDYAPNTKVSIVLPFIGDMPLDPDVVMGRTLNVSYFIDLLSGACIAFIRVNGDVLYQFQGNCAAQAPLTGADFSRIYAAAIGAGMTLGAGIVAGIGAGSAAGAATAAKNLESISEAGKATASLGRAFNQTGAAGKGLPGVASMRRSLTEMAETVRTEAAAAAEAPARVAKGTRGAIMARAAANTVREVMGGKMTVSHSGSLQGNTGLMGIKVPYLIVERPSQSLAENYKHYVGYPSNIYATLGSLTGYTECEQIVVSGINCTDGELSEIEEILKGGFYL